MGGYSGLPDKYYSGRRPSGMYIPRFRNLRSGEGRPFTRGYAFEVYTGRSGWRRGNDAPGIGADLKKSLTRPGDWFAYMEGYCESVQGFERDPVPGEVIHEMGTARMGRDPKTCFLNGFNQCHESSNVFVTDGSCMPSTACQNPSFTYMALTARACHYAVEQLKRASL
jgi:choline dehydrogenase-like flavoprotein